ncbi:uncharacterized protein LOC107415395 [Ziziphus jujuba]|uniref:Uncharacterized protein LOC107415395 n=1 Tax=Ziziphus jujuba TaxID=326968 RepID=A0A6P3ZUM9_ZIZJJ|nr:uncharacterized protein LOC107415395 [Ziziphus jujuba]
MQEQNLDDFPLCPSFNSYSSDKLVDTAAKVCREFDNLGLETSSDQFDLQPQKSGFDGHDDDFEFVSLFKAGDDVSVNGQMGQVFPVFNRDLLLNHGGDRDGKLDENDEDEESVPGPPSSSSSEVDELEGVPPGTYCVWTPKRVPESPGQCKKSKSTGSSSKRWRIRDLLRRSNSDGKDSFVFLTPLSSSKKMEVADNNNNRVEKLNKETKSSGSGTGARGGKGKAKAVENAHEVFYVKNRKLKEEDKRRSFLPYRQDLVGFFANVNAMGKGFPPF